MCFACALQQQKRAAAEAASDLVRTDRPAASDAEAIPIVFLHGVGLGMVRDMALLPSPELGIVLGKLRGSWQPMFPPLFLYSATLADAVQKVPLLPQAA